MILVGCITKPKNLVDLDTESVGLFEYNHIGFDFYMRGSLELFEYTDCIEMLCDEPIENFVDIPRSINDIN